LDRPGVEETGFRDESRRRKPTPDRILPFCSANRSMHRTKSEFHTLGWCAGRQGHSPQAIQTFFLPSGHFFSGANEFFSVICTHMSAQDPVQFQCQSVSKRTQAQILIFDTRNLIALQARTLIQTSRAALTGGERRLLNEVRCQQVKMRVSLFLRRPRVKLLRFGQILLAFSGLAFAQQSTAPCIHLPSSCFGV